MTCGTHCATIFCFDFFGELQLFSRDFNILLEQLLDHASLLFATFGGRESCPDCPELVLTNLLCGSTTVCHGKALIKEVL